MRSSCAPYKDCFKNKKKTKKRRNKKGGGSKKRKSNKKKDKKIVVYFAGGCFWGIEDKFMRLNGVVKTRVGYMGGEKKTATYEQICKGNTNHIETVEVTYDPQVITYEELVKEFFTFHNPHSFDKQGLDVGKQYRAVIFYTTNELMEIAKKIIMEMRNRGIDIKTQLQKSKSFYPAEEEHQQYLRKKKGKFKGGTKKRNKNILGKELKVCSTNPMTGFYRDGYCRTGPDDPDKHTVCAKMNKSFLDYTKKEGNDLSSVVKSGQKWCLCESRWSEAFNDGKAPKVVKNATNSSTSVRVKRKIKTLKGGKRGKNKKSNSLPRLRKVSFKNKKHKYKLKDPQHKRILAINEGIRKESKKENKTLKEAAISKKGRFNILRIYRRNNNPKECKKLTKDMKYIDKKYKLGKTKDICNGGGSKKRNKNKKRRTKKKEFLYNPDDPKKSFDVYIDKDPSDTIPIKYTTLDDVKKTIRKLERLYKNGKYPHKRIWQVGMILRVRLKVLKDKKPKEYKLAERYFQHLGKRTKIKHNNKDTEFRDRKNFIFEL